MERRLLAKRLEAGRGVGNTTQSLRCNTYGCHQAGVTAATRACLWQSTGFSMTTGVLPAGY